jgi:hypothetical protein
MIERSVALFGTSQPVPPRLTLIAGPLTATLENGALRWVRHGDVEVLRAIAWQVRDRNWDTPEPLVTNLVVAQEKTGFRVTFDALCRSADGELPWVAEIIGEADGTLRFTGTARPHADFLTNRTGFVVLHPLAGVAGRPVEITHTNGETRQARFPEFIDPEQCFLDIRSLAYEATPGLWATCRMEGDTWEMEDHRNWLDASFKTYVRPLALPFPYKLAGGSEVTQSVTLKFSGRSGAPSMAKGPRPVAITFAESQARMPAIGLRVGTQSLAETMLATDLGRMAGIGLVNARFDPRAGHDVQHLRQFGELARAMDAELALEIVVPCRRDPARELKDFAGMLRQSGVRPESIAVAVAEDRLRLVPGPPPPDLALLGAVYGAARDAFPKMTIGGGTFGFFAELNRNWPPFGLIDYITHIAASVVHAADDRTMMENLESLKAMARTVQAFVGAMPYRLLALSLGLDSGPYGEPAPNPDDTRRTLVRRDPRQRGLFAAAWTLGALAEAAHNSVAAVTPAALTGDLGIVACGDRLTLHPVYHVVRGLAQAAGRAVAGTVSSDPARVRALGCREASGRIVLWLANLTDEAQRVTLPEGGNLRRLDEETFAAAGLAADFLDTQKATRIGHEIEIGAYGIALIEMGE